ncbi:hypothetical protein HK105_206133 [Polyrhizophydium stewartii]|uniref:CCHC-type domain-containing protein n=1 Tax=Polyrhizophydium stewartii TaxID=2732419 RepID=A0ABR4N499_9FUNG
MADPGHHIEASTQTAEMVQALCVRLDVTEYRLEAQAGVNVFVLPLTGAAHLLERFAATADALVREQQARTKAESVVTRCEARAKTVAEQNESKLNLAAAKQEKVEAVCEKQELQLERLREQLAGAEGQLVVANRKLAEAEARAPVASATPAATSQLHASAGMMVAQSENLTPSRRLDFVLSKADRPPNPERLEDELFNYAMIGSTERALQAFFFDPAGSKGSSSCKEFVVLMASHLSRVDPRVTNSRRCELIVDRLRGTAALWALDERMSPVFDQLAPSMLLQKLLATFNSGDSPHELEEQLRTFRQGSAPLHDALQLWRDLMARTGLRTDTPEGFFLFRTMITNDLRIKMLSVVQSQSFEKYAETALAHDTHLRAEKKAIAALPAPRAAAAPTAIASSVVPMDVDAVARSASGSSTSKRFTGRCFYCKFVGHRVAECRGKAADEKTGRTDHKDKGLAAVEAVSPLPSSSSSSEN